MKSVPKRDVQLNGETLTRHEKAALWMALHQLRLYDVESLNEKAGATWDPEEIANGKRSILERVSEGSSEAGQLTSLGSDDVRLIQRALGYYVFTNESCTAGEKRRAREIIHRFEDLE